MEPQLLLNIERKSYVYVLYITTWFPVTLTDLQGYFSYSKPFWIQYLGICSIYSPWSYC